jgi:hypothetical protein
MELEHQRNDADFRMDFEHAVHIALDAWHREEHTAGPEHAIHAEQVLDTVRRHQAALGLDPEKMWVLVDQMLSTMQEEDAPEPLEDLRKSFRIALQHKNLPHVAAVHLGDATRSELSEALSVSTTA